jgi:hypothetical protein
MGVVEVTGGSDFRNIRVNRSWTLLLTPCSRVRHKKLTGFQLVKKIPAFYGTRRFITLFTNARHLSISWASSIQSIKHIPLPEVPSHYYPPIYAWVIEVVYFPQVYPSKPCIRLSSPPYALHDQPISLFSILSHEKYWARITDHKTSHYLVFSTPLLARPY